MYHPLTAIVIFGLATSAISITITKSHLSQMTVQKWLADAPMWLRLLFSCPYCMAHYVAGALLATQSAMWPLFDKAPTLFLIQWAATVGMAAIFNGVIGSLSVFTKENAHG